jgi:hypothetical protein
MSLSCRNLCTHFRCVPAVALGRELRLFYCPIAFRVRSRRRGSQFESWHGTSAIPKVAFFWCSSLRYAADGISFPSLVICLPTDRRLINCVLATTSQRLERKRGRLVRIFRRFEGAFSIRLQDRTLDKIPNKSVGRLSMEPASACLSVGIHLYPEDGSDMSLETSGSRST